MRRRIVVTEIVDGINDSRAEKPSPDTVDRRPGEIRVVGRGHPACQKLAPTCSPAPLWARCCPETRPSRSGSSRELPARGGRQFPGWPREHSPCPAWRRRRKRPPGPRTARASSGRRDGCGTGRIPAGCRETSARSRPPGFRAWRPWLHNRPAATARRDDPGQPRRADPELPSRTVKTSRTIWS